jgi:hypothetical protein
MVRALHASTQVMIGSFSGDGSGCFSLWFLYILSFHSASLQWTDFVWAFK